MRAVLRLRVATIRLVLQFHDVHPDPSPAAAASLKRLTAHLDEAMRLEAEQQDRQREARGAVESRGRAEAELRARMVQLVRLSRVVAQQERLTDLTCQMRAGGRLPTTLMTDFADALARATRHRDVLLSYGLPEVLLRELEQWNNRLSQAELLRQSCIRESSSLTPAIGAAVQAACRIIRHLDALNQMRFAGDARRLEDWARTRRADGQGAGELVRQTAPV